MLSEQQSFSVTTCTDVSARDDNLIEAEVMATLK